jgi:hypothetical protein
VAKLEAILRQNLVEIQEKVATKIAFRDRIKEMKGNPRKKLLIPAGSQHCLLDIWRGIFCDVSKW